MEDIRAAIAENITELRQGAKLTQSNLADILNYSDKAVSKWERGEAVPDITVLKQIADYFDVKVDYLLTRKHDNSEHPNNERAVLKRKNHFIISALSVMLVWLLTMLGFTVLSLCGLSNQWSVFLIAVPVSFIVVLVFNSIWGVRRMNFLIVSLLTWSVLVTVHVLLFAYLGNNVWRLYLIGVPAQLIIILSGFIKFKK